MCAAFSHAANGSVALTQSFVEDILTIAVTVAANSCSKASE